MHAEKADDATLTLPNLTSAIEVMGTKQGDVLGRLPTEEEERKPQLGSVLASMTVAMAALSWKFLEQPFNGLKRHFPYEPEASGGPQEVLTQSN